MERDIYIPPGGPPRVDRPDPRIFAAMGEESIFRMIHDLYHEIEKSEIRPIFTRNMEEAADRAAAFFVGLLGGPPLYNQRYGQPMLRARHLPFVIDKAARDVWIGCFRTVLVDAPEKYGFPAEHIPQFQTFLDEFSLWMVNTA